MAKKEHSINEVYDLLTDFVGFTKNQFEKVEKRFERNEKVTGLIVEKIIGMDKDIKDLKISAEKVEAHLHHVAQNHERRITRLERAR